MGSRLIPTRSSMCGREGKNFVTCILFLSTLLSSNWQDELAKVTAAGYSTVLSAPWYLNYVGNPYTNGGDWIEYYKVEPLSFNGTDEQKKLVLGSGIFFPKSFLLTLQNQEEKVVCGVSTQETQML